MRKRLWQKYYDSWIVRAKFKQPDTYLGNLIPELAF
ncbi:hypothetical protein RHSA111115_05355 [Rheinheimera salexigens]